MKRSLIIVAALSLAAIPGAQKSSSAGESPLSNTSPHAVGPSQTSNLTAPTIISTNTFNGTTTLVFDIAGAQSWDLQGDPSNTVLSVPLANGDEMTGIGWDVNLTTVGGSWLSEAAFYFDGSDQDLMGLFLTPGAGDDFAGTSSYSSGGVIDLAGAGIPNIPVLADGNLYIECFESFDDAADAVDADWTAGSTLTIVHTGDGGGGVPTVGQWGLISLTVLLFAGVVMRSVSRKTS